jgi:hypothetical protein
MAQILDGKAIAAEVRGEVTEGVEELEKEGHPVRLDVVLIGEYPASVTYGRNKQKEHRVGRWYLSSALNWVPSWRSRRRRGGASPR